MTIINASCSTFFPTILLLCANHAKQNIKKKLRDLVSDTDLRKTVLTSLFGNEFTVALVYSNSPDEFDVRFQMLCEKFDKNPKFQKFSQYFQVHKADIFRYHLIKGVVGHSGIVDIQDLFTTNSTESINSVLKSWENSKNDPYSFTNSYEKLLDNQNSNILQAFLGLESHDVVREEFESYCMEFLVFSQLTCDEKEKLKNELCNVIVDKKRYEQVIRFKNHNAAIKNMRKNIDSSFSSRDKNLVSNMEIICQIHLMKFFFLRLST